MNELEFVLNGVGQGPIGRRLMRSGWDPGALRPVLTDNGQAAYLTLNRFNPATGRMEQYNRPTTNANATLRKDEWILLDRTVTQAAKARLQAWTDLRRLSPRNIPNGMGVTAIQYQAISDITPATVSMDGLRKSERDRPVLDLRNFPLPIIHKDWSFPLREIATSQNRGEGIDVTTGFMAGRKVGEEIEKILLGVNTGITYGGGTVYGYTNFPDRITYSLTDPTEVGWSPRVTLQDMLAMKAASQNKFYYGPWMVYCSPNWDAVMDDDFSATKGDLTLRERIGKIKGLNEPQTLDYLTGYTILLVQMDPMVAQAIVGMDVTTLQWQEDGGMEELFKTMAIMAPLLRSDINLNTGIVHGA